MASETAKRWFDVLNSEGGHVAILALLCLVCIIDSHWDVNAKDWVNTLFLGLGVRMQVKSKTE